MENINVDAIVIGGGMVGLAVAERFSRPDAQMGQVLVLEQHPQCGSETSSRNSEVIHAGIFYLPNTLKALLCKQGNQLMYDFCQRHSITHRRCGKLILAQAGQRKALQQLQQNAAQNGISLTWLEKDDIHRMEPAVHAEYGLFSKDTGVVDSHQLQLCLQALCERAGVIIACHSKATQIIFNQDGSPSFRVTVEDPNTSYQLTSRYLINSGGLQAQNIAHNMTGFPTSLIPHLYPCKGCYFSLAEPNPFRHLIYPLSLPGAIGLGLHVSFDLAGKVRFGPDSHYLTESPTATTDYTLPTQVPASYYDTIRTYYPALKEGSLSPDYAGIRPKLQAKQGDFQDFMLQNSASHGIQGLVHLFGIESPGLTSAFAIADKVYDCCIKDSLN